MLAHTPFSIYYITFQVEEHQHNIAYLLMSKDDPGEQIATVQRSKNQRRLQEEKKLRSSVQHIWAYIPHVCSLRSSNKSKIKYY